MKREILKQTLFLTMVVIAGVVGGWLYVMIFGNNNLTQQLSNLPNYQGAANLVIQEAKKVVVEQDQRVVGLAIGAQNILAGIYKKQPNNNYDLTAPLAQGLLLTNDGWLLTNFNFDQALPEKIIKDYVAVLSDKQIVNLDQVVKDEFSGLVFCRAANNRDWPVNRWLKTKELHAGQELVGINWNGPVWLTSVSLINRRLYKSSEDIVAAVKLINQPEPGYNHLALFDLSGAVAALVTNSGIIASDYFSAMTNNLLAGKTLRRPYLGVYYQDLSLIAGAEQKQGVRLITKDKRLAVAPVSPAARAGLKAGDIIISLDGQLISSQQDLPELLLNYQPGDKVKIKYLRQGKEEMVETVLGEI